jgi:4-hydroxybenzoate polyprenyltransferase
MGEQQVSALIQLVRGLTRPAALFIVAAFCHLGLALAGDANDPMTLTIAGTVVAALLMHAVAINDLADEAVDAANGLERPLATGQADRSTLRIVAAVSAVIALTVSTLLAWPAPALVAGGIVFGLAYSLRPLRLSGRGIVGLALLPVGYVLVPLAIGFTAGHGVWTATEVTILAGCSLGFIGRIVLKDLRDLEGDTLHGKRTFLVRYGRTTTCALSAACWVIAAPTVLALPDTRGSLVAVHLAMTVGVLICLGLLADATRVRSQTRLVNGIAILGRLLVLSSIAHLAMREGSWPGWRYDAAMAALAIWTIITAVEAIRLGPVYASEPTDRALPVVEPEVTIRAPTIPVSRPKPAN